MRIARNRLSRILCPTMSQAIQKRQETGPTAAIEFQRLPVQLSPVSASNSCSQCNEITYSVKQPPACLLDHSITHIIFFDSSIQSSNDSWTHSHTDSLSHACMHAFTHSFIHRFIHPSIHTLFNPISTHAMTYLLTRTFMHSSIHSLTQPCLDPFIHTFICMQQPHTKLQTLICIHVMECL